MQHEDDYQEQEQPSQRSENIGRYNAPAKALLDRFENPFCKTMVVDSTTQQTAKLRNSTACLVAPQ
jgi:hypothetical protein